MAPGFGEVTGVASRGKPSLKQPSATLVNLGPLGLCPVWATQAWPVLSATKPSLRLEMSGNVSQNVESGVTR